MNPNATINIPRRVWLREAADLLGGGRALARALNISEASVRKLLSDGPNNRGISDGIVKDTRAALHAHAAACAAQAHALIAEA